ncbi:MAG: DUF4349 domain-containing protein, partial [Candidatus Limnocylindria bacterium]
MARRSRLVAGSLALAALVLAACGATTGPSAGSGATAGLAEDQRSSFGFAQPQPAVGAPSPEKAADGGAGVAQTVPIPQVFDGERLLIQTGNVSLRASDPWAVSDQVQAIASGLGGDVISLSQSGSGDQRHAMLTFRVPQARFNDALRQIRDIADIEVLSSSVEGQDVTDQFIDLEARLKAKVAEEQRYLALLGRAESIEDILRIDQVLAQVRTQIEQLTAQLNVIKARTTYSTIVVQVIPLLAEPPSTAGEYDPARTLERAVAALASLMRVAADALIWALVFAWLPLMVLGI